MSPGRPAHPDSALNGGEGGQQRLPHAPTDERSPKGVLLARAAAVGCYLRVLFKDRAESFAAALYLQRHAPIAAADEAKATRAREQPAI